MKDDGEPRWRRRKCRKSVVIGSAAVDDERHVDVTCKLDLLREDLRLGLPRRIVAVVVEPRLAHSDSARMSQKLP